jgi:hypothetical protein
MLATTGVLQAGRVIFKDGFTLEGTIKQDRTVIYDSDSGAAMSVPKLGGYFWVDDGARKIAFSPKQALDPDKKDEGKGGDPLIFESRMVRATNFNVPSGHYGEATPWNAKWDRVLTIDAPSRGGNVPIAQHLSLLTPHFARIDARRYNWSAHYLTSELEPNVVRDLLYKHASLKLKGDSSDVAKRLRVFRFLARAGWYDKGFEELNSILKDFPDQKDKIDAARESLQKLLTAQLVDLIQQAQRAGRHQWAQARLATFPQQYADETVLAQVRALQATYETANKNISQARQGLESLPGQVTDSTRQSLFTEAAAVIASELSPDTISRLEPFLGLARQAERDREQGRAPAHTPEQLLAVAVSSWLMGTGSAEAKVDTAMRLWQARQFVLEYQKTYEPRQRQRLLEAYQQNAGLAFDELAQLIRFLPPPEPFEQSADNFGPWALGGLPVPQAALLPALFAAQRAIPTTTYEREGRLPWASRAGPTYRLQLPPEYHAGRLYPVLFVLHEAGEKPEDMMRRWTYLAAQNGYILVAPEWQRSGLGQGYNFTVEEQRAVIDVLRELRHHFQVDSDRVFVSGLGEGANMAFDVGLSHPDLFAGVLPVGGRPRYFAVKYWPNAVNLPFYVVDGDLDGDGAKDNKRQFDNWISHQYPSLYVLYRGRGSEWFQGELPYMFDWMGRKKREFAVPDLRRGVASGLSADDYQSMRPSDNRFYWLSGEGLSDRYSNESARSYSAKVVPATLQARISEGNQINVHANGFRRVVVWLGPGMIDFDKPVKIYVNVTLSLANRKIVPNLATLLEDVYQRGDHQRVFLAKVELAP